MIGLSADGLIELRKHKPFDLRSMIANNYPLNLRSKLGMDMNAIDADASEAYDEAICEVIAGRDKVDEARHKVSTRIQDVIDIVSFTLILEHLQLSPIAMLAIAATIDDTATFICQATDMTMAVINPWSINSSTSVWLTDDIRWAAEGAIIAPLADTMAHAAKGRRLAAVISHPVLDRFDLTVTDVIEVNFGWALMTDANLTGMTAGQMIQAEDLVRAKLA